MSFCRIFGLRSLQLSPLHHRFTSFHLFGYFRPTTLRFESQNQQRFFFTKGSCGPRVVLDENELKKRLTPKQYQILRLQGTERAFTGEFYDHHEKGIYECACCGQSLFDSETKFESGSGWPSFFSPAGLDSIETRTDSNHGMVRTEVICQNCHSHLGHVFPDGPKPTDLRYCINSASLAFKPPKKED